MPHIGFNTNWLKNKSPADMCTDKKQDMVPGILTHITNVHQLSLRTPRWEQQDGDKRGQMWQKSWPLPPHVDLSIKS